MLNIKYLGPRPSSEDFPEHPIEDSSKGPCHIYSVNNIGYLDTPSDFMRYGCFDLEQYSLCLIKTVFMLPAHLLSPFLDYQCNQLKKPFYWLTALFHLIIEGNSSENPKLLKVHAPRVKILVELIEKKMSLWTAYVNGTFPVDIFSAALVEEVREKYNFDLVMQEMETKDTWLDKRCFMLSIIDDYRTEVVWDEPEEGFLPAIIKQLKIMDDNEPPKEEPTWQELESRMVFYGSEIDLANYFSEYRRAIDEDGKLMSKDSTSHFVEIICNGYCKTDGSSFDPKTTFFYLENYDKSKGKFWDLKPALISS